MDIPGKTLALPELIAIGVGGMIGGGIFSILGLAVDISGHAAPFAFMIGSVIACIAAYSYVRLALTFHTDGASFTYLERAFPENLSIAGIAGWTVVFGYIGTLALYAYTFGAYSAHLLGYGRSGFIREIMSIASLLIFLSINLAGARKMGRAEDIAVYTKILLLATLAIVGFYKADTNRLTPLFDQGYGAVFLGGAVIFVAYEGFQLIANAVCEASKPERDLPRAMYGSIAITSCIYVLISFVAVGNLGLVEIHAAQEYALAAVTAPIFGQLGVVLVDIAAILATSSAINATIYGASHMAYEISVDNLAPRAFSFRNKTAVPVNAAVIITGLAVLFSVLGDLDLIATFSSLTFLLVSIAVSLANVKLRELTHAALFPVLTGIVLMLITVTALLIYLASDHPSTLFFSMFSYVMVATTFLLFRWHNRRDG